ncbi:hypothetical protein ACROYT_G035656 [Oculina patagonica]
MKSLVVFFITLGLAMSFPLNDKTKDPQIVHDPLELEQMTTHGKRGITFSGAGSNQVVGGYNNAGQLNQGGYEGKMGFESGAQQHIEGHGNAGQKNGPAPYPYGKRGITFSGAGSNQVVGGYGNAGQLNQGGYEGKMGFESGAQQHIEGHGNAGQKNGPAPYPYGKRGITFSGAGSNQVVGGYNNAGQLNQGGYEGKMGFESGAQQHIEGHGNAGQKNGPAPYPYGKRGITFSGAGSNQVVGGYGNAGQLNQGGYEGKMGFESGAQQHIEGHGNAGQKNGPAPYPYGKRGITFSGAGSNQVVGGYGNAGQLNQGGYEGKMGFESGAQQHIEGHGNAGQKNGPAPYPYGK